MWSSTLVRPEVAVGGVGGGGPGGKKSFKDDDPPNSRLFVVCDKSLSEKEFREAFQKFGDIEDVWIVKNKHTGERKGVTYIKFSKTSQAAEALETMNGRVLKNHTKPLKVLVANCRSDGSKREANEAERLVRLFVLVPKNVSEEDLRQHFQTFGEIKDIQVLKDFKTGDCKGFAYVRYHKASHAAKAYENCDRDFKAVFAEPKPSPKTKPSISPPTSTTHLPLHQITPIGSIGIAEPEVLSSPNRSIFLQIFGSTPLSRRQWQSLFDLVPGLDFCEIYTNTFTDFNNLFPLALIKYNTSKATQWALDKFQQFEYPPGSPIFVREVSGTIPLTVPTLI